VLYYIGKVMRRLIHQHTISFRNAFAGLLWAFRTQPNFRVHGFLSAVALFLSWYFQIPSVEWTIIIFTIVLGIAGELINTSIESMTDLITTEWKEQAKIAKDVAAGMMLFIAFGSVFVACFIFVPYISKLFSGT
jgi:diacylglycerol kinase (ATP)